jgi:hypothetical protein
MTTEYIVCEAYELTDKQWAEMKREYEELHSDSQGDENQQSDEFIFIAQDGEEIPF